MGADFLQYEDEEVDLTDSNALALVHFDHEDEPRAIEVRYINGGFPLTGDAVHLKPETLRRIRDGLARYTDPTRAIEQGDIVKYREVVDPSDATSLYVVLEDPAIQSIATQRGEMPARILIRALGTNLPFPPTCTRNLSDLRVATAEEIAAADAVKLQAALEGK